MKKIFFTLASLFIIAFSVNAQTADVSKSNPAADKEAKAKAKEKQNKDLDDAMKQAGFTEAEATKFKEVTLLYNGKASEIRKIATVPEDAKTAQLKTNTDEKNAKLKEIVGEEKYRAFNKVRKAQKEAAATGSGN